jgi:deoxycytidine triphosphate deaminase
LLLVPQILLGGAMVKFDKLNKRITSQQYVPIIGDLMASRWSYEALSVYQFMNNKYEKYFYRIERKESEASFNVNYLIPELQLKLQESLDLLKNTRQEAVFNKNISILRNEIIAFATYDNKIPLFKDVEKITPEIFNSEIAAGLDIYLKKLRAYYLKIMNAAIDEKDREIDDLGKRIGGKEKVVLLRQEYYNDDLAEQVLNKRDNDKIIQYKNRLLQKAEPAFHLPESRFGRAHLFAPYKRIGKVIISTYWFNLAVLWLFIAIFYLCLQLGIFKKGTELLSNIGFRDSKSESQID